MPMLYALPEFLDGKLTRAQYIRWLERKAAAHVDRDRKRTGKPIARADYKRRIHEAVCASCGLDGYTGESLNWHQISTYNNEASKRGRSIYKKEFALLPSVDHVLNADESYDFMICAWRTNDAKHDLSLSDFLALCRRVLDHHERRAA